MRMMCKLLSNYYIFFVLIFVLFSIEPSPSWHLSDNDVSIKSGNHVQSSSSDKDLTIHSEDEFTIVNVSSLHLGIEDFTDYRSESLDSSDSNLSVMILSQSDYQSHKQLVTSLEIFDTASSKTYRNRIPIKMPIYHGAPNAFVIEIVAAMGEHENGALVQLLEASFGCFPNRDYCIIGIPSTIPVFPILKYFVRVTPRPICSFQQELYVLHRNTISSTLFVREMIHSDLNGVEKLISKQETFMADFKMAVLQDNCFGYVMLNGGVPVGIAIIKQEEDVEYLKTHYELNKWFDEGHHKAGSHGVIEHLLLTPIFQRHSRFFLNELHRLSDFTILYYRLTPKDGVRNRLFTIVFVCFCFC